MSSAVKGFTSACTFCGVVAVSIVAIASIAILIWAQMI